MPATTIVLIHGLWMTPRSWERFQGLYESRGHRVLAPAWPRMVGEVEDVRRDPAPLNGLGLDEIVAHYERIVRGLDAPPILMGHSFGGLVTQLLLDRGLGAAGVAIDAVPPKGILRLPISVLRASAAVLRNPANRNRTVALTFEQFAYAFANTMDPRDARAAYDRYAVPGPGRPVFQAALANLVPLVDGHSGRLRTRPAASAVHRRAGRPPGARLTRPRRPAEVRPSGGPHRPAGVPRPLAPDHRPTRLAGGRPVRPRLGVGPHGRRLLRPGFRPARRRRVMPAGP